MRINAEQMAAWRASQGTTVTPCTAPSLRIHLHTRCLLSPSLLSDLRDARKYPNRVANCDEPNFKKNYSFAETPAPRRSRWTGTPPVRGATVTLDDKKSTTNIYGVASFVDLAPGRYIFVVAPSPAQMSWCPAGPELPVTSGYDYTSAPSVMYRYFLLEADVDASGWVVESAKILMPLISDGPAYAGIVGAIGGDLYLDWKPDWFKVVNRERRKQRSNKAIVLHQTCTFFHEQIGSPIACFTTPGKESAHYLVDLDGHVVKLVHEDEASVHAGPSHWRELNSLNAHGIGIETVHTDSNDLVKYKADGKIREFPSEQMIAIARLVG